MAPKKNAKQVTEKSETKADAKSDALAPSSEASSTKSCSDSDKLFYYKIAIVAILVLSAAYMYKELFDYKAELVAKRREGNKVGKMLEFDLSGINFNKIKGNLNLANTDHCSADDHVCVADAIASATSLDAIIPKSANVEGKPREAVKECVDRYPDQCKGFAANGQCPEFPGWNTINCPKSCGFCHLRDPAIRCNFEALKTSPDPVFPDGVLTSVLENIPSKFGDQYEINVLSTDPWIMTFENFVNDDEAAALIKTVKKWERSTDSGQLNEYGEQGRILSQGRTSSNAWCDSECEANPLVQNVYRKIEAITQVPQTNYESFQILRYEIGQHYQLHHDMSADDNKLMCGPRILTMFLYLSDVESGGETAFPYLNVSVKPVKGRALLWPSVLDRNGLTEQDVRTHHQAMPVLKGLKFAANAWIHSHDYAVANKWGCTGSFADL